MALAKAGMKIVEAPPVMSVPQLRQFLALAPFKTIYFDPVSETQDCLLQLRKAIPEFFDCNYLSSPYCFLSEADVGLFQMTTLTGRCSTPNISPRSVTSYKRALIQNVVRFVWHRLAGAALPHACVQDA